MEHIPWLLKTRTKITCHIEYGIHSVFLEVALSEESLELWWNILHSHLKV